MIAPADRDAGAFEAAVSTLLAEADVTGPVSLHPLPGGANNRVYRISSGDRRLLLKSYHEDARTLDRSQNEYAFARFAWSHRIRVVPRPLAHDPVNRLALYEYADGVKPGPDDVTPRALDQALAFYRDLNDARHKPEANRLPCAKEACFSIEEHVSCVDRRIDQLRRALPTSCPPGARRDASVLVHGELGPTWKRVRGGVSYTCARQNRSTSQPLPPADRRLSPSDFGFHNTIMNTDGRLTFFDFEYAGWDDPAKLVCDFFCQPAVPVPMEYYEPFAEVVAADLSHPPAHRRRFDLLLPVYRVKWACILLNEFMTEGQSRREFAGAELDESRLHEQIGKAHQMLYSAPVNI